MRTCNNDTEGEPICNTYYETVCETSYKSYEVEQDEPICKMELMKKCDNVTSKFWFFLHCEEIPKSRGLSWSKLVPSWLEIVWAILDWQQCCLGNCKFSKGGVLSGRNGKFHCVIKGNFYVKSVVETYLLLKTNLNENIFWHYHTFFF